MQKVFQIGPRSFALDQAKAEQVFMGKRVINGYETMTFNLLPLKYQWAYDLYRTMKANHWDAEEHAMARDVAHWRDVRVVSDAERDIVRLGVGYFAAAEAFDGYAVRYATRELVTAPELKLVLGRHTHEENVHTDSLVHMTGGLGLNPHTCEARFRAACAAGRPAPQLSEQISPDFHRGLDLTLHENKQLFAKTIFLFSQCVEGTKFFGLHALVLSLYAQGKFPAVGQIFRNTLRDEAQHIEFFRNLFLELIKENGELWTEAFREELRGLMATAIAEEKRFVRDGLGADAVAAAGLRLDDLLTYLDTVGDRRLEGCNLASLSAGGGAKAQNPLPWLDELLGLAAAADGGSHDYQKTASLNQSSDDDL
ncbi:response regulator SirA [Cephaloticoccus capnophilus]|uniref:ribonucleoside-diphosphate reductase n=1 Tax=Cephaloticoccus capnophilus TaxID=1548208 RepID=A0A139SLP1_9BACT|nr:ribonucleotide-diphosphate reductase subunit beta [Cephaloticoccus capnophilus]KXU35404.1 response regulator SirA [Cephaloticoccus capnophilus]